MSSFDVAAALGLPALPSHIARVEQKLTEILPPDNPYLSEPVARLLQSGGKRLRPSLVIAVAASQGKKINDKVITSCAAIELLHVASLVHDDIIDNAASRHKTPTINHREGVNHAIIVGDYLLAKSGEQAAMAGREIAQTVAAAFAFMCDGQARELADTDNLNRTQASYIQAVNGKTAALFAAACKVGGLCADLPKTQVIALARYGEDFGMAYQLIDDILDFVATSDSLSKPTDVDARQGNYTLPVLLALGGPNGKTFETLLLDQRLPGEPLTDALLKDNYIDQSIRKARTYSRRALHALSALGESFGLENLPPAFMEWALAQHLE
ncbi:MAG TPA: polyprenyl synthetase family protein [Candidatus Saccharimonadales bacterium]|jgi:geranylgeranyl pyrophosphate synthase